MKKKSKKEIKKVCDNGIQEEGKRKSGAGRPTKLNEELVKNVPIPFRVLVFLTKVKNRVICFKFLIYNLYNR
ncbi:MAG: hypothetical protein Fur0024_4770 [Patescibacteria group bacterium]